MWHGEMKTQSSSGISEIDESDVVRRRWLVADPGPRREGVSVVGSGEVGMGCTDVFGGSGDEL